MSDWSVLGAREFAVGNYIVQKVCYFEASVRMSFQWYLWCYFGSISTVEIEPTTFGMLA